MTKRKRRSESKGKTEAQQLRRVEKNVSVGDLARFPNDGVWNTWSITRTGESCKYATPGDIYLLIAITNNYGKDDWAWLLHTGTSEIRGTWLSWLRKASP